MLQVWDVAQRSDVHLVNRFHVGVLAAAERWGATAAADWVCFLEADVYFVPENFRRVAALRALDPTLPLWVGGARLHDRHRTGILLEPQLGTCLSAAGLERAAAYAQVLECCKGFRASQTIFQGRYSK